jgi:hypothetical protein
MSVEDRVGLFLSFGIVLVGAAMVLWAMATPEKAGS